MSFMPSPPKLSLAFELHVQVGPPMELGLGPKGLRRIIPILGGTFEGPGDGRGIRGRVLPGGADWQIVRPNGVADLDTRYTLETDAGKLVYVQNAGIRHAPGDVMKRIMAGEKVDPSLVYFRSAPVFETSAPELEWMTRSTFVGTGERAPSDVVLWFWRVEYRSSYAFLYIGGEVSILNRFTVFILAAACAGSLFAQPPQHNSFIPGPFIPGALIVSRVHYDGNNFGNATPFPDIFNDPSVPSIQGSIFLDQYLPLPLPFLPRLGTLPLTGITTSFSSKSEGAVMRSPDGRWLAYMGYQADSGTGGVSNSETPGAQLTGNADPSYNREVAIVGADGTVTLVPETNAYSGDNPRAAITVDGAQFYMVGNGDNSLNKDGTGPGTTLGARYGTTVSALSTQLGVYIAADRTDESAKKHIKDNNFRGVGIFGGNLYISKGSGGNGDNGIFQVHNGTGDGLPSGTGNTITQLLGGPATLPDGSDTPYTPFGFWFANATTLYIADEGYANLDANGNLIPDPLAGLEKWILDNGVWKLAYTLTSGLDLYQPKNVPDYPVPTYTTGLRNLTGQMNHDGTVTIYAITAQYSAISGGEPDPTRLVGITDVLRAKTLPPSHGPFSLIEKFFTLQTSRGGDVFRGVALAPCGLCGIFGGDHDGDDR
jgi:Protein of unknown function (DUF3237)